jgi:signal transduction histidine kinase
VKGYSEALITGIVKNEDCERYLWLMNREAGRMERLVGDLLDLSRLDSEEFQLDKTALSLSQIIEDSLQKYWPIIKEKDIILNYELDPDIIIHGDEGRIEQVFQNIVDNAIQYTKKGEIRLKLFKKKDSCCIEISDTGIGIPPEDIDKLKQRFYRVNKARTRKDGGTGLGLAIVEKIVNLHDGKLTITSKFGEGTTVRILLPMLDV